MHGRNCIRTDGDWKCGGGCTHDREESRAHTLQTLIDERDLAQEKLDAAIITLAWVKANAHDLEARQVCSTTLEAIREHGKKGEKKT